HVGPVSAAPPGVKAGSVVRSGGLTPALYHTGWGATLKNPNTLAFFFLLRFILKTTKNKKNQKRICLL
ncbi:hypothetical protein ACVGV7_23010, partial [Enterobacter intestinihominis]